MSGNLSENEPLCKIISISKLEQFRETFEEKINGFKAVLDLQSKMIEDISSKLDKLINASSSKEKLTSKDESIHSIPKKESQEQNEKNILKETNNIHGKDCSKLFNHENESFYSFTPEKVQIIGQSPFFGNRFLNIPDFTESRW